MFERLRSVDDNTSLSAVLLGAKAVFDYQEESDVSIDLKIPFETKALPRRELADDGYNHHNEFAMNGELCTSSERLRPHQ